jgi:hypothetical protein
VGQNVPPQLAHTMPKREPGVYFDRFKAANRVLLDVDDYPEFVFEKHSTKSVLLPAVLNGRIDKPGAANAWKWIGKKSDSWNIELRGARLGSRLDGVVTILDAACSPPRTSNRDHIGLTTDRHASDITLLDGLIDGFEKNETMYGFHWRQLPMPDQAHASARFYGGTVLEGATGTVHPRGGEADGQRHGITRRGLTSTFRARTGQVAPNRKSPANSGFFRRASKSCFTHATALHEADGSRGRPITSIATPYPGYAIDSYE